MTAPVRPSPRSRPVDELAARAGVGRAARRARLLRRVVRGLLLLVALAGLAWVLLASRWLGVDDVQVVGQSRVTVAQVQQAAAVPDGTPLARVDSAAVERRVRALAPVAGVEVSRSWPGTLRVALTERVAVAGLPDQAGVRLVDVGGVVFGTEPKLPPGLVELQVADPGPSDPSTRAGLAVLGDLPPALREQVRTVRVTSPASVLLVLSGGRQVVWGSVGDTETKAAAALVLLRQGSRELDVSAPGVVVRRDAPSPAPTPAG